MSYILMAVAAFAAVYFASKYFKQKSAIRLLAESMATRSSILTDTQEFRGTDRNWGALVEGINSLLSDIQQLDKQNRDRLKQIETTFGSMREGVLIIDRDNYILLANSSLQDHFANLPQSVGQRVESVLRGSGFLEFIREVKIDSVAEGRELVFSEGPREMWMEVSASRLELAEEGNAPWYLFVFHDITKLKELESMRQQFVANASHELKTPVSVIKGYAETLVADHATMEEADRDHFIKVMQRHSDRLSLLINDLLSLSRLESDSLTLDSSRSELLNWIREVSCEYEQGFNPEGRGLILDLPHKEEAWVRFDALKLRQVLDNLFENARKYSPPNSAIRLSVAVGERDVGVSVIDEGPGVPEADLSKIFERFYRVDKGRSRDSGGTGLGLSIVKHIVDRHEGRVWAENLEDKGFKVVFQLPLNPLEARETVV